MDLEYIDTDDTNDDTNDDTDTADAADDIAYGWPGDGSGEDDFADYNQNEANDYKNDYKDDYKDDYNCLLIEEGEDTPIRCEGAGNTENAENFSENEENGVKTEDMENIIDIMDQGTVEDSYLDTYLEDHLSQY